MGSTYRSTDLWFRREPGPQAYIYEESCVSPPVKEQTFHKRSTNVPQTFRCLIEKKQKKPLSSFPNLSYRRWSFLFCPGEQILDKIETICFQQEKSGNKAKKFWFRFLNDIGTFVLSFDITSHHFPFQKTVPYLLYGQTIYSQTIQLAAPHKVVLPRWSLSHFLPFSMPGRRSLFISEFNKHW
jgi:hypothetical protein